MNDELSKTWQRSTRQDDDAYATHVALPVPSVPNVQTTHQVPHVSQEQPIHPVESAASLHARKLLDERYQGLTTHLSLSPYDLWVLAEAVRLGMEHPEFLLVGAGSSDGWHIARQLWAACYERLEELDSILAAAMHRPH